MFTEAENDACARLVEWAIREDLGPAGDITSRTLLPADLRGRAQFVQRSAGVTAGLSAAEATLESIDRSLQFEAQVADGSLARPGQVLATVSGSLRSMLTAERVALNFLQRLSGVATLTRKYVEAVAGLPVVILDTRKTTPGWRLLEKYAVRMGGGKNHRMGLYDGVLIKDNHLAALGDDVVVAVQRARHELRGMRIECEVDTLEQLRRLLPVRPDIVLLDNMSNEQLREAVQLRNELGAGILLEASGGVNLTTVRGIAETGVDRISVGALTHSAVAQDIALDYVPM
ncbi:carboxylating nicotinate-nucleotide diphosphorylase [soil metagenome]